MLRSSLSETSRHLLTSPTGRLAVDVMGSARAVVRGFRGESLSLRAAALTYLSIFSLVPSVTVALVLLKSFGQEPFQERIRAFLREVLAPGFREETAAFLERTIDRAGTAAAGGIGFAVLALSAGLLLKNFDASLNALWNVRRRRAWPVRLGIYALILLLGPLLLAFSLMATAGLSATLQHRYGSFLSGFTGLSSLLTVFLVLTVIYLLAPDAPVRVRSAMAGGLLAAASWELAKVGYSQFAVQILRANPIWGSLGAAPLFLSWIYVSWFIVLLGARLAYAMDAASYQGAFSQLRDHPRAREVVAAQIAQQISRAFLTGGSAPTVRSVARRLEVPEDRVRELVEQLEAVGLLMTGRRKGLLPGRHPDDLTLGDLSAAVGAFSSLAIRPRVPGGADAGDVEGVYASVEQASLDRLAKVRWTDLAGVALEAPEEAPAAGERSSARVASRA